jgi:hypothetical protein
MKTLRRLLAALLLVAPALESGAAGLALSSETPEMCKGHVCFCPPRPSASSEACHGGMDRDATAMTGACHHDPARPGLAATAPYLLSAAPALLGVQDSGAAPLASSHDPAVGHARLPLLPPRTA